MNKLQSALMSASYQEALDYLYGFINLEHRSLDKYAPENYSLDRAARLLELLGNPQLQFRSIHIAGTKGKGSVAAMCAFSLRAAGLRCALYTSPHLQDFRDRIRVLTPEDRDGQIPEDRFALLVDKVKAAAGQVEEATWYELVTAIAFLYFAEESVDIAVIEVGLGGRLDATNVLTPLVSVITSLSLDHTYLLGDTLEEIAFEKAGIIKDGIPVISAPQAPEGLATIERIALKRRAPLSVVGQDWRYEPAQRDSREKGAAGPGVHGIVVTHVPEPSFIKAGSDFRLGLAGQHQRDNALVAVASLNAISAAYPQLSEEAVRQGLAQVVWPGRLQILAQDRGNPTLLVDCAHNVDSSLKLAYALENDFEFDKLVFIIGVTADKDVRGILKALLPLSDFTLLTSSGHPRASTPAELQNLANELGYECSAHGSVAEALQAARAITVEGDLICVTGSIFVVGDLLNQWEGLQSRLWHEKST